jgi:uncharacterized protein with NRDE domain
MCLLVIAYKVNAHYPLIVAANRDEFLDRPAEPMHFWPEAGHILAGRDLRGGGTWMGITLHGYFAALTNHRDMTRPMKNGPSRGQLVRAVLGHGVLPSDTTIYQGFNLVHGHWRDLHYHNNIDGAHRAISPGVHGLSNGLLNTPWPKVELARKRMTEIAEQEEPGMEDLFGLLADESKADVSDLPDTGIGLEWEMILSAVRIRTEDYGTRCSTVLIIDADGVGRVQERTIDGQHPHRVEYEFVLRPGMKPFIGAPRNNA